MAFHQTIKKSVFSQEIYFNYYFTFLFIPYRGHKLAVVYSIVLWSVGNTLQQQQLEILNVRTQREVHVQDTHSRPSEQFSITFREEDHLLQQELSLGGAFLMQHFSKSIRPSIPVDSL